MDYTKRLEAELLNEKAKLAKMTSTVKQLGAKLKTANQNHEWAMLEADHYRDEYHSLIGKLGNMVLTIDEQHERANEINNRNF